MALPEIRVDWFRMLVQLKDEGWSLYAVSHFTDIPKSTLIGYKQGSQPSYHHGVRLLACWSQSCGKEPGEAPTVSVYSFMA
ncbi:hypothetical protein ACFDR9_005175 [Janthinobacterium sp. CG_23.3]|uniref:hypothetical protein n=1 Tax=unclassified Janthinobacterium TaxID=2610881 RepID=UPI002E036D7C|nr:hypothetical protein [Janthinobacterium sp. CG_S6]